jgi:hypothetical protein
MRALYKFVKADFYFLVVPLDRIDVEFKKILKIKKG